MSSYRMMETKLDFGYVPAEIDLSLGRRNLRVVKILNINKPFEYSSCLNGSIRTYARAATCICAMNALCGR